ncbi:MAG: thiamine pyrophosphate-binding protein [Burkholderiales bacterium]
MGTDRKNNPAPPLGAGFRMNLNVAQLLLEYLRLEGVTRIFGVPGGAVIYIMDELQKQSGEFDFVICRHESGAAYIADGYSRVTGGLGVVLTTSGPSATNALTGAMNAQASNSSLLIITGEVPRKYFGMGYLQEGVDAKLDINGIFRNAVQFSAEINDQSNFQTLFQQALREARSTPPRTSHISLPGDVAGACVIGSAAQDPQGNRISFPSTAGNYRTQPSGTDVRKVNSTLDDLLGARRPLIFLGNGCRNALDSVDRLGALRNFVDRFGIPVMTTPDAKGIFPESHALSLRNYGMTACSWPQHYLRPDNEPAYDVLLVLGSSLGELSTSCSAKDQYGKILIPSRACIQVDLDQSVIGRDFPITRGIVAEVGATIDALCASGETRQPIQAEVDTRKKIINSIKQQYSPFDDPAARNSDAAPVHPAAMMRIINELVDDGHIVIDAGNCVGWSLNYMVVDPPLRYHSALAMGPMGFGVAAVIGAKLGAPEKTCIGIVGDAAFMMHGAEISTAAQQSAGAIWVVLYDNDLGMVSQGMAALFPPAQSWRQYYRLGQPNLVLFAQGLGANAVGVTLADGTAAFRNALLDALRLSRETNQPQVIVVSIDTRPMPPYGWPTLVPVDCSKAP